MDAQHTTLATVTVAACRMPGKARYCSTITPLCGCGRLSGPHSASRRQIHHKHQLKLSLAREKVDNIPSGWSGFDTANARNAAEITSKMSSPP